MGKQKQTRSAHSLIRDFLNWQVGRFLIVGSLAFTLNAFLLYFLHSVLGLNIVVAQLLGAEGTIAFSFLLHHNWTYEHYGEKPLYLRFIEFNVSALGGSAISTASVLSATGIFDAHYLVGLSVGAVLATSWNYFASVFFVWSKKKQNADAMATNSPEALANEAEFFSEYLINTKPTDHLNEKYAQSMQDSSVTVDSSDEKLLHFIQKNPWSIAAIDAGLAFKKPHSEVRRRIYTMLALLESTPEYTDYFLTQERSRFYILIIGIQSFFAGCKALFGMALLGFVGK